jgi:hypothetical protein
MENVKKDLASIEAKHLVDITITYMKTKCPHLTAEFMIGLKFNHSHQSLCEDDIRDLLIDDPDVLKNLLEECLMAKQIVVSLYEKISTLMDDYRVTGPDVSMILNEIIMGEVKWYIEFPLFVKQKLLTTACRHPSKKVFGSLPIPLSVEPFAIGECVYPTIYDKNYVEEEAGGMVAAWIQGNIMEAEISPHADMFKTFKISPGPGPSLRPQPEVKGLVIDDYRNINADYIGACHTVAFILFTTVFLRLGKVQVKSESGMREKVIYRQKPVNDMCRVTVHYDGQTEMMDEGMNLASKMEEVKRKLEIHGFKFSSEDVSGNGKPKLIYSFNLNNGCNVHPIWLEVQFSNITSSGITLHDHVDYELRRLTRGPMTTALMRVKFEDYRRYNCGEDNDCHDINIILKALGREEMMA